MNSTWVDSVALDESLIQPIGGSMYPWAAWNHAQAGFVAPVDKIDGFDLTLPWPQREVAFGRGVKSSRELCYVIGSAQVAILATRTTWYDSESGEPIDGYREGARSRLQVLALAKDSTPLKPVILTFKGVAAGDMTKQVNALRRGPIAFAQRQTGRPLSEAAFWVEIYAGPAKVVGASHQVEIVPPLIRMPERGVDAMAWLGERFVGPEVQSVINLLTPDIVEWRPTKHSGSTNGERPAPVSEVDEIPMFTGGSQEQVPADQANGISSDGDFDTLPGHARSAYVPTAQDQFWSKAGKLGLREADATKVMAKAATMTGDWNAALTWLSQQQRS